VVESEFEDTFWVLVEAAEVAVGSIREGFEVT
jgi:hypothetical protein